MQKLVILDRDGVINKDSSNYIRSPEDWEPLEGSLQAIALLKKGGWTVAISTNQSGIARGYFSTETLDAIHTKMQGHLRLLGAEIDHIEYCPHGPDDDCQCRKPKPGMLQAIARKFNASFVDLPVIGDSDRDIQAAINVGARPILVLSGNGEKHLTGGRVPQGVEVYKSLLEAAKRLIHPE